MSAETDALHEAEAALEKARSAIVAAEAAPVVVAPVAAAAPAGDPIEQKAIAAVRAAIAAARAGAKNVDALRAVAHDLVDQVTRV